LQSAADWCVQEEVNFEQALEWAERAVQAEERFETLNTKAQLLGKLGKSAEAAEVTARAVGLGNAQQLHFYGRQLLGLGKTEEAMKVFKRNVEKHPDTWFVKAGLARGYAALGDFDNAVKTMKEVLAAAPEPNKANIEGLVQRLEKKENIN
jgi:tetratricopeptide (TPR) repeat protein